MGAHINDQGEFQSDKYPTCPAGKVPLSVKDPSAQSLLWEYAQRRRAVDSEFSDDLETALRAAGFVPPVTVAVPARVGERYRFAYPDEPQFNRDLTVTEVLGHGPDDLVLFDDHSHTKQKYIDKIEKLT